MSYIKDVDSWNDIKEIDDTYIKTKKICERYKLWRRLEHISIEQGKEIDQAIRNETYPRAKLTSRTYCLLLEEYIVKPLIKKGEIDIEILDEVTTEDLTLAIFKLLEKRGFIPGPSGTII